MVKQWLSSGKRLCGIIHRAGQVMRDPTGICRDSKVTSRNRGPYACPLLPSSRQRGQDAICKRDVLSPILIETPSATRSKLRPSYATHVATQTSSDPNQNHTDLLCAIAAGRFPTVHLGGTMCCLSCQLLPCVYFAACPSMNLLILNRNAIVLCSLHGVLIFVFPHMCAMAFQSPIVPGFNLDVYCGLPCLTSRAGLTRSLHWPTVSSHSLS